MSGSNFSWLSLGAAVPSRDPNDDEDEDQEYDKDHDAEPAVIREPDEE